MPPGQGVETALTHFHAEHERAFAFRDEARPVEVYAARVVAEGVVPKPQSAGTKAMNDVVKLPGAATHRQVYFSERSAYVETPVYKRDTLIAGARIAGPAVVEQLDSTVILSPGTVSSVTPDLHIITRFEGDAK
jgi:N-methylhydantoinase A